MRKENWDERTKGEYEKKEVEEKKVKQENKGESKDE